MWPHVQSFYYFVKFKSVKSVKRLHLRPNEKTPSNGFCQVSLIARY